MMMIQAIEIQTLVAIIEILARPSRAGPRRVALAGIKERGQVLGVDLSIHTR